MSNDSTQVYSATYSNVPVFEFVTEEGPIMRRKNDSWINATHILKAAKFAKPKRTRILEKDVQSGIHDKVQGGYGKYQGTYVPLDVGKQIAETFEVYDKLRPIFEFRYVEGKSQTPPPAPKHSHSSAATAARKRRRMKPTRDFVVKNDDSGETLEEDPASKRKPKARASLSALRKGKHQDSGSAPFEMLGPNMGVFSSFQTTSIGFDTKLPPLRQDTERDLFAMNATQTNTVSTSGTTMNVHREDLEIETSEDELDAAGERTNLHGAPLNEPLSIRESDDDGFLTGRELFGTRDFITSKFSFEKFILQRGRSVDNGIPGNQQSLKSLNVSFQSDPYAMNQQGQISHSQLNSNSLRGDSDVVEYFNSLIKFVLEDNGQLPAKGMQGLPEKILNPPQPLNKINISQPIDDEGNTIFHWVCSMANVQMIEFLLTIFSSFVNSELRNNNGETPLMFLVQFNNSYLLGNFATILNLLFDSLFCVDNYGRTVLHQIALIGSKTSDSQSKPKGDVSAKREVFAKYYFDVIFSKILDLPEFQLLTGDKKVTEEKQDVVKKFVNHQDVEGNTAFHIIAFNLSRKCIRTFIRYHKYFDFSLRNFVDCSVEDYLAVHNYVLRLEDEDGTLFSALGEEADDSQNPRGSQSLRGLELQKFQTRKFVSSQAGIIALFAEELTRLSNSILIELREKDDKAQCIHDVLQAVKQDKSASQRMILQFFNLGHLADEEFEQFVQSAENGDKILTTKEGIIQEEISRLNNDLCFQLLSLQDEHDGLFQKYKNIREKHSRKQFLLPEKEENPRADEVSKNTRESNRVESNECLDLAIKLQQKIIERRDLANRLYEKEANIPVYAHHIGDFKENEANAADEYHSGAKQENVGTQEISMISNFPPTDRLYKYCRLISLSCGMSFVEVESSIDLIEQSLSKPAKEN